MDIWAIGCILAELLLNFIEHEKNPANKNGTGIFNLSDVFMFPGDSCYPISPIRGGSDHKEVDEDKTHISGDDQLIKILEIIGSLNKSDYSFIQQDKKKKYLETILSSQ